MLENATRICEAKFGTLFRYEGDSFPHAARCIGAPPDYAEFKAARTFLPTPGKPLSIASYEQSSTCHIADASASRTAHLSLRPISVARDRWSACRC